MKTDGISRGFTIVIDHLQGRERTSVEKPGSCHLKLLIKVNIISVGQIESVLSCQASVRRAQHQFCAVPLKDTQPERDLRRLQTELRAALEATWAEIRVVQVLEGTRCKNRDETSAPRRGDFWRKGHG